MPFRKKEIQRVFIALHDPEFRRAGVEVDGAGLCTVHAAEIDREFAIDEGEQVVISGEREDLAAFVGELRAQFQSEVEVVVKVFVSETLSINREERIVRIREGAISDIHERNFHGNGDIDSDNVVVPLVEVCFARRGRRRWIAGINGFTVGTERAGDNAQVRTERILEIGMTYRKIAHDGFENRIAIRSAPTSARAARVRRKNESAIASLARAPRATLILAPLASCAALIPAARTGRIRATGSAAAAAASEWGCG